MVTIIIIINKNKKQIFGEICRLIQYACNRANPLTTLDPQPTQHKITPKSLWYLLETQIGGDGRDRGRWRRNPAG